MKPLPRSGKDEYYQLVDLEKPHRQLIMTLNSITSNREEGMTEHDAVRIFRKLLSSAGIAINGGNPWDMAVHNQDVFGRVLRQGVTGLGESYMEGWWDCQALDQFFDRVMRTRIDRMIRGNLRLSWDVWKGRLFSHQKTSRAYEAGIRHYDIGSDLFQAMLGTRMVYTCGCWKGADNLEDAQRARLDLVCSEVGLEPGMKVLDLGCGWGAFARHAAECYGAEVTGVTGSREQAELGSALCTGLPVDIRPQDYRTVRGKFDRVVSIGIMEHAGHRDHRACMEVVSRTLKGDGVGFFHTMGGSADLEPGNPWTVKYIFPHGQVSSISQLGKAMEGLFVVEDWRNIGRDYDLTLMAWHEGFEKGWPLLQGRYSERFRRMWRYYLLSSAGMFRSRSTQLWQVVVTKHGVKQPMRLTSLRACP
jgi:cyclopropane-fatty-acyl-phospholipid synthase